MEKIHDLSDIDYDYNNDIAEYEFRIKHQDNKSNDPKEDDYYEFHINDTSAIILYSKGYLVQKLKILKPDGTSVGEENVTFVNGGGMMHSKWLTIGNTEIETNKTHCSIQDQVLRLINFTHEYVNSQGQQLFFYPDTVDSCDKNKNLIQYDGTVTATTPITEAVTKLKSVENENYNEGFKKRWELSKNGATVIIYTPLKYIFDFFNDYTKAFSGFQVQMKFQRNPNTEMLITDVENVNYKVEVEDIHMLLPYIKFNTAIAADYLKQQKESKNIDIYWNHFRIIKSDIQEKNATGVFSLPGTSNEVLSVYVIPQYIVRDKNYNKNNLIFDNLDMTNCYLTVNTRQKPSVAYKMNFNEINDNNRLYEAMLHAGLNDINAETGCLIDKKTFAKLYPIICFDLSHHESYREVGTLEIEFNWDLRNNTDEKYRFYFILKEKRKTVLNMADKTIENVNSLKKSIK